MSTSILREVKMILTSVERNNNKFWTAKVLGNNEVVVTFGRVGTRGASQLKAFPSSAQALRFLEAKMKEKEKGGYMRARVLTASDGVLDGDDRTASSASATPPLFKDLLARAASEQLFPDDEDVRKNTEEEARMTLFGVSDSNAALTKAPVEAVAGTGTEKGHRRHAPRDLLSSLVRQLVEANTHKILSNTSMSYDESAGSFRTPLGIVSQDAVDEARLLLGKISDLVASKDTTTTAWQPLLERYLMLIPRDVGRYRPTLTSVFPDLAAIKAENSLLDALEASVKAVLDAARAKAAAAQAGDPGQQTTPRLFRGQLIPIFCERTFSFIDTFFKAGINDKHYSSRSARLHRVYACRIDAMAEAFEASGRASGNTRRLWHGTRPGNVVSILTSGLQVPPPTSPHVTGRLYGDGLYFASQSTKSLNYSIGVAPGQGGRGSSGRPSSSFMFLCDVALGRSFVPGVDGSHAAARYPVAGFDSTWAKGGVSPGVINDEFIVYRTAQAKPLYLCEFR